MGWETAGCASCHHDVGYKMRRGTLLEEQMYRCVGSGDFFVVQDPTRKLIGMFRFALVV